MQITWPLPQIYWINIWRWEAQKSVFFIKAPQVISYALQSLGTAVVGKVHGVDGEKAEMSLET